MGNTGLHVRVCIPLPSGGLRPLARFSLQRAGLFFANWGRGSHRVPVTRDAPWEQTLT